LPARTAGRWTRVTTVARVQLPGCIPVRKKCQVPSAKCQVPSAKCQVPSAKCQVPSAKCQVPSAKQLHTRSEFLRLALRTQDSGLGTRH
jgi:hypothetical protein